MAFDKPQSRNEAILQNMLGANNELEPPKSRVEALLQDIAGQMPEANPSEGTTTGTLERLKIGDDIYTVEGGGSGTSDYDALNNKPQIAGVTLSGDKSLADLGIASATAVSGILDGTDIDSFGDVETALGDKVDKVVGKGLSTNDYDDTEKAAVTAATTAIAGIKDGTTIDSFGDVETALGAIQDGQSIDSFADVESAIGAIEDGTTIDSFADVESALADKQDATDSNLQTTADTIVGAINEHEGDISSLKSGLTNLDNEVNGDATEYPYADVITINDAVPANLAACSVKVEPVQDLHGYDKPWVGGAGKNLLDPSANDVYATITQLSNGVRFESPAVTGTRFIKSENSVLLKANTTYYFSCGNLPSNLGMSLRDSSLGTIYANVDNSYTPTTDVDAYLCYRLTDSETAIDAIITPQVEVGSQPTTFAPYTNICPITGHTEAVVTRDGKNLWVGTFVDDGFRQSDTYGAYGGAANKAGNIETPVIAGEKYTFSINGEEKYIRYIFLDENKADIGSYTNGITTIATPSNAKYLKWRSVDDAGGQNVKAQLEIGEIAHAYVPHVPTQTYTLALGDTIYGGTVDFKTGVMTVDRKFVTYTGSVDEAWNKGSDNPNGTVFKISDSDFAAWDAESFEYGMSNMFAKSLSPYDSSSGANTFWCNTYGVRVVYGLPNNGTSVEDFKTFLQSNNLQVVGKLATHTTLQLTPEQIQLLQGTNTLYASTGDISVTVNGVSGAIGAVQAQANATDSALAQLAADIAEQLPDAPTTDGAYVLTVTVADGTPTYSWKSAE